MVFLESGQHAPGIRLESGPTQGREPRLGVGTRTGWTGPAKPDVFRCLAGPYFVLGAGVTFQRHFHPLGGGEQILGLPCPESKQDAGLVSGCWLRGARLCTQECGAPATTAASRAPPIATAWLTFPGHSPLPLSAHPGYPSTKALSSPLPLLPTWSLTSELPDGLTLCPPQSAGPWGGGDWKRGCG